MHYMIKYGFLILILCVTFGMGGCSSVTGKTSQGAGSSDGVTTVGLGPGDSIQGMNVTDSVLLSAPHNQSYYFDYNSDVIWPKYTGSINAQANYMVQHPNARLLLAGNTDARGSHEYNIALGERRALAVASQLKMAGVNKNQIRIISYGDMKPIALGHSEAAYARNRRVDLIYEAK